MECLSLHTIHTYIHICSLCNLVPQTSFLYVQQSYCDVNLLRTQLLLQPPTYGRGKSRSLGCGRLAMAEPPQGGVTPIDTINTFATGCITSLVSHYYSYAQCNGSWTRVATPLLIIIDLVILLLSQEHIHTYIQSYI